MKSETNPAEFFEEIPPVLITTGPQESKKLSETGEMLEPILTPVLAIQALTMLVLIDTQIGGLNQGKVLEWQSVISLSAEILTIYLLQRYKIKKNIIPE